MWLFGGWQLVLDVIPTRSSVCSLQVTPAILASANRIFQLFFFCSGFALFSEGHCRCVSPKQGHRFLGFSAAFKKGAQTTWQGGGQKKVSSATLNPPGHFGGKTVHTLGELQKHTTFFESRFQLPNDSFESVLHGHTNNTKRVRCPLHQPQLSHGRE